MTQEEEQRLEHGLYHVLVARIERYFRLDPCPAIKASDELTRGIVGEAVAYLKWSGE